MAKDLEVAQLRRSYPSQGAQMRITVLGAGYVGLMSGLCFAEQGHRVDIVDPNVQKIAALQLGRHTLHEPDLDRTLQAQIAAGRIRFCTDLAHVSHRASLYLICVGTAQLSATDASENLLPLEHAIHSVVQQLSEPATIVIKSTVPVGFTQRLIAHIHTMDTAAFCSVAMNPEFLREGSALHDVRHPDRIIIGTDDLLARDQLRELYTPWTQRGVPLLETTPEGAETIKHAANAFLATKISFMNEIAALCEHTGAPVADVARGIGMDPRIGPDFLRPGPGFGGSCLPKDLKSLIQHAKAVGATPTLLEAVWRTNQQQQQRAVEKIRSACGGSLHGRRIALLGLAFKAGTNDLRASPAVALVHLLTQRGALVQVHDPAVQWAQTELPPGTQIAATALAACEKADVVCLATDWPEYRAIDWTRAAEIMHGTWVVDLRAGLDADAVTAAGLSCWTIGQAPRMHPTLSADPLLSDIPDDWYAAYSNELL